jgi:hypothetical protein
MSATFRNIQRDSFYVLGIFLTGMQTPITWADECAQATLSRVRYREQYLNTCSAIPDPMPEGTLSCDHPEVRYAATLSTICSPLCPPAVRQRYSYGSGDSWQFGDLGQERSCLLPRREGVTRAIPPLTEPTDARERAVGRRQREQAQQELYRGIQSLPSNLSERSRALENAIRSELLPLLPAAQQRTVRSTLRLLRDARVQYQRALGGSQAPYYSQINRMERALDLLIRGCSGLDMDCPRPALGSLHGGRPGDFDSLPRSEAVNEYAASLFGRFRTPEAYQTELDRLSLVPEGETPEQRVERTWKKILLLEHLRGEAHRDAAPQWSELKLVQHCRSLVHGYRSASSRIHERCAGGCVSSSLRGTPSDGVLLKVVDSIEAVVSHSSEPEDGSSSGGENDTDSDEDEDLILSSNPEAQGSP